MKWKEELRHNITEACEVRDLLKLGAAEEEQMCRILERFPMTIPRYYYSLIDRKHPDQDPIRKMCIPSVGETDLSGKFDTSGEAENTVMPGMQHKYRGDGHDPVNEPLCHVLQALLPQAPGRYI